MLAAFGGWGDAGSGPTGALGYILGDPPLTAMATLDPEACFDFTVERPITKRGPDGRWRLDYPEIGFYAVERPDHQRDLLLLRGPEPHTNWLTLSKAMAELVAEYQPDVALTLGAFVGPVSHRSTPLLRRATSSELDVRLAELGMEDTSYAGPTAFVTALLHALSDEGVTAASIWGAGPAYLGAPNPSLSLALLEGIERAVETDLDLGRLRGLATDFQRKVEAALRENPEVAERLGRLIELGEDEGETLEIEESSPPDGPPDLPSGRDLVDELEKFFRERRGDAGPQTG